MQKIKNLFFINIRRFVLFFSILSLKFNVPYLLTKFLKGEKIETVNGFKMFLDLKRDVGISKDLFIFKKREHLSTDFLLENGIIKEGNVTLDAGANIGYYALLQSKLVGDSGMVYAVEPVINNYEILNKNISLNSIDNIKTFNLAFGSKNEIKEIHVSDKGNVSSFIKNEKTHFISDQKIEVQTIDYFVQIHNIKPVFVRMDVEGFETEIVKGMQETLKMKPKLLIEVHPHLINAEIINEMFITLISNNYTQAVVIKERSHIWMKKTGELRPILRFLNKKINGDFLLGPGSIQSMEISQLLETLSERKSAFHVLLS